MRNVTAFLQSNQVAILFQQKRLHEFTASYLSDFIIFQKSGGVS